MAEQTSIPIRGLVTDSLDVPSRNVYDAVGQRVLRVDPDGTRTVYAGSTELRWTPGASSVEAGRVYGSGVRQDFAGDVQFTVADHQGTAGAAVNASTGAVTYNHFLADGALRAGDFVDDKGFLGQTHDNDHDGLVYLNNRHYDPSLGVFVSVDPLVTKTMQPYIYGGANPVTFSDRDELCASIGSNCPDGIPVVHDGRADHRSWVWPLLEERALPADHSDRGLRKDFEKRAAQHDAWLGSAPGAALPAWGLPIVLGYSSPQSFADAASGGRANPFAGCGWDCALATGTAGLLASGTAGGICFFTAGLACGAAVTGAIGATSVVFEATSTDADGGDLVCAFFLGPSSPAASASATALSGGATLAREGIETAAGEIAFSVIADRAAGSVELC